MQKAYHYGLGRHATDIPPSAIPHVVKWIFLAQPFGVAAPILGRVAFCIYLMGIVGVTSPWKYYSLRALIVVQVILGIICVGIGYGQCGTHMSALWDFQDKTVHCLDANVLMYYAYVQSAVGCFADLYLTVVPAVIVRSLHLERRVKIGLSCLLCLSVL